ncbi:MAG: lipid-binding SYLF domain-containing protein [Cognatishimia sp.]|uniref:lipid-binding SYLF domain-containing protein n=1 Tax=Cognatishimia sp. TaxID=2211648 RepID=UPI004059AB08
MKTIKRRALILSALAGVTLAAGCGNGINSRGSDRIDARVDATIQHMYRQYPNTQDLANKASGMLVMPLITEAGLGFGGGYGRGALRVGNETVDYYSSARANFGFQIGAQQYAHVLFFMTDGALQDFQSSSGWAAGADLEYVFSDRGDSLAGDTTTLTSPIIAIVFGRAGARIGATLEGSKYSRIIP